MPKNLGCSGGFYEGIRISQDKNNSQWCWIMDDDTIPDTKALESLIKASELVEDGASFFASTKFDVNGGFMTMPDIDSRPAENGFPNWYAHLDEGIVKLRTATFVSIMINSEAIDKCGLPLRDYFIWGDDTEYTLRLTTYYGPAYMTIKSCVCHKRIGLQTLSIFEESNMKRIRNYYYFYRNNMINAFIYYGRRSAVKNIIRNFWAAIKVLKCKHGFKRFSIILRGTLSGCLFWKRFDRLIKSQIKPE